MLHGLPATSSAVTVMAAEGPNQVGDRGSTDPEATLTTIARRMAAPGSYNVELGGKAQMAVVISPEHRRPLQAAGWTKTDVQRFLWEHARPDGQGRVTPSPADILVLTAGGEAGRFSAVIPGWTLKSQSAAVTLPIQGR